MRAEILFPIFVFAIVSFALFCKNRADFWANSMKTQPKSRPSKKRHKS